MKYLTMLLLSGILLCGLCGCGPIGAEQRINALVSPVTVVVVNKEGLVLRGGDGSIAIFPPSYYISETLLEAGTTNGTILR